MMMKMEQELPPRNNSLARKPSRKNLMSSSPEQQNQTKKNGRVRRLQQQQSPVKHSPHKKASKKAPTTTKVVPLPSMIAIPLEKSERESSETSIMSDFSDWDFSDEFAIVKTTTGAPKNHTKTSSREKALDVSRRPSNARIPKSVRSKDTGATRTTKQQHHKNPPTMKQLTRSQSAKSVLRAPSLVVHDKEQPQQLTNSTHHTILPEPSLRQERSSTEVLPKNDKDVEDSRNHTNNNNNVQNLNKNDKDPEDDEQLPHNFWQPNPAIMAAATRQSHGQQLRRTQSDKAILASERTALSPEAIPMVHEDSSAAVAVAKTSMPETKTTGLKKSNSLRDLLQRSVFHIRPLFQRSNSWNDVSLFNSHSNHDALASVASVSSEFSLGLESSKHYPEQKELLSSKKNKPDKNVKMNKSLPKKEKSKRTLFRRSKSTDRLANSDSQQQPTSNHSSSKIVSPHTSPSTPSRKIAQTPFLRSSSTPNLLSRMEQIVVREQYEAEQSKAKQDKTFSQTSSRPPADTSNLVRELTRSHSGRSLKSNKSGSHHKTRPALSKKRKSRRKSQI